MNIARKYASFIEKSAAINKHSCVGSNMKIPYMAMTSLEVVVMWGFPLITITLKLFIYTVIGDPSWTVFEKLHTN